jgi:hypothetical protein
MSATYLHEVRRQLEALTLDELHEVYAYLREAIVRRRAILRGADADELELELPHRDTDPAPLALDEPGEP